MKIPTPEERRARLREFAHGGSDKPEGTDERRSDIMMRLIAALQLALDDNTEDIPSWDQLRDRLVAKVEALKARDDEWRMATKAAVESGVGAVRYMDVLVVSGEKFVDMKAKAAKWDAMQVKLDEHPYNPARIWRGEEGETRSWGNEPDATPLRVAAVDAVAKTITLKPGDPCDCKQVHNGKCTACGKQPTPKLSTGYREPPSGCTCGDGEIAVVCALHPGKRWNADYYVDKYSALDRKRTAKLYGIEVKDHDRWKSETVDAKPKSFSFKMIQEALRKGFEPARTCVTHQLDTGGICMRCGNDMQQDLAFALKLKRDQEEAKRLESVRVTLENGPGLRAQGGKYTEPGEPIIYVDNGWDEP